VKLKCRSNRILPETCCCCCWPAGSSPFRADRSAKSAPVGIVRARRSPGARFRYCTPLQLTRPALQRSCTAWLSSTSRAFRCSPSYAFPRLFLSTREGRCTRSFKLHYTPTISSLPPASRNVGHALFLSGSSPPSRCSPHRPPLGSQRSRRLRGRSCTHVGRVCSSYVSCLCSQLGSACLLARCSSTGEPQSYRTVELMGNVSVTGYTTDVLTDSLMYAEHAKSGSNTTAASITPSLDDVRLAVQARTEGASVPKEVRYILFLPLALPTSR